MEYWFNDLDLATQQEIIIALIAVNIFLVILITTLVIHFAKAIRKQIDNLYNEYNNEVDI